MKGKNIITELVWAYAVYKFGKFIGKIECLDDLPDNTITFKLGRKSKFTVSKANKNS